MSCLRRQVEAKRDGTIVVAGIRWHVAPAAREALADALDLEEHLRAGNAKVIKSGPHRSVYQVQINGLNVFWKHCRISGPRAWMRQCLRPPKARMEFDRALALAQRDIPTVEPLAWGRRDGSFAGESFLITRTLMGAVPLQTISVEAAQTRRHLSVQLGQFLAQLHEAGVTHPDLHPGNILVVEDENGRLRFHLIDLHSIQLGARLSWPRSRDNLVIFNRWFAMRSSRADRHRFWQSYTANRNWNPASIREQAREIEQRTIQSNLRFWNSRDQRCLGTNRYFRKVRSTIVSGYAVREMDKTVLQRFLDDPDFPFRDPAYRVLKDSRTSTVVEMVIPTPAGPREMIYKRFRVKKRLAPLLNRLHRSAALRSWQLGHALRDRGLPTPRPWLVLHRRSFLGPREGYQLCEKVENPRETQDLVGEVSRRTKWHLIAELARLLRQFHEARLSHRDLKAANLLWSDPAVARGDSGGFHFIDLVGVRSLGSDSQKLRVKNLTRLNVSFLHHPHITRTDKLRFLRTYLCWGLNGRADWKDWWKNIAATSQAKVERNRRSGRPLA